MTKGDETSIDSNVRCALGINKKTGRLQWCPGCNCIRIMIVIPITMLPLVLIFVLFTHTELVATIEQDARGFDIIANVYETTRRNSEENDLRCTVVPYEMSETLDMEERELLKDVRTSFIPPELVMIPPNCQAIDTDLLSENDNLNSIQELNNYQNIAKYLRRRRNTFSENITEEMTEPPRINSNSNFNSSIVSNENAEISNLNDFEQNSLIAFHAFWKGEGTPENIRTTQAQVMKMYMNTTVDPCVDFYQYACGNWEKVNPIPKDKAAYDTFEMLRESLDTVLRDLLTNNEDGVPINDVTTTPKDEEVTEAESDLNSSGLLTFRLRRSIINKRSKFANLMTQYQKYKINLKRKRRETSNIINSTNAEIKAKNLYESCMNYDLLASRGITPLLDLLKTFGGWPVLDPSWNESDFDWLELTAKLRLYNNDIFLVEWVGPDIKNSDENVIQFDQTSLGLPTRDYFLQASNLGYLEAYNVFMKTVIILLGANQDIATEVAQEIIDFETDLAKITSTTEERSNVSILYSKMTVGSLHDLIPQIDWKKYLTIILEREVNSTEVVVNFATGYMQKLVTLLSETEQRTISNYLLWRFVRHRVNNLDDRFQDAKQKFYKALFGREQSPPRWKNCVNQVNSNMGMAVGAMFVRKYFDENSKKDTLTMTHELQDAFREILNQTEWIEGATKHLAELKVNAMSLKIGYPDLILSHDELNDIYKDLNIDPHKYFENTLSVLVHLTRHEHSKLGQVVNKTVWHTAPAVVNAYYSRNKNQIMFPAGILQPPFYHRYFPKALNYGGIGVVVGHELTHGFDDKGRLFDRDGNLHRWWSDADIEGFHERALCLISQYGNYNVSDVGINVDGTNTQGENIADNGGIKQAFLAYKKWLHHQDTNVLENEQLPGINATNTQLFFLNFAQVWCGAMRPEAQRNKLKTAVHSPGQFRVIGTLSNSDDFAKEYNCPLNSPMNPSKKCSVW